MEIGMTKLSVLLLMSCTAFSVGIANAASGLISMSDNELVFTEGQALMSLSYIAPNDSTNLEKLRDSSSNIGFYRLGMEAKVELNANIANLQLGCGEQMVLVPP
jgi:hypothetical protein